MARRASVTTMTTLQAHRIYESRMMSLQAETLYFCLSQLRLPSSHPSWQVGNKLGSHFVVVKHYNPYH
jgi:hypothetical protein